MDDRRNHPCCGSPLGVMLLLQAHFNPEPLGNGSTADTTKINELIHYGLIEEIKDGVSGRYKTTSKGQFHVKALTQLPFPEAVSVWITPRND